MKIIAINGSPNGASGNTGQVLAALMEGAREAGADTEVFLLGELTVTPCRSCRVCQKLGTCVIDDDYPKIKAAMIEADGIVLASPNYIYNVSAQMKALLDRSFSMFHCQMLAGTYGAAVLTSGGPLYAQVEEYLMHVIGNIGCWKAGSLTVMESQLKDHGEKLQVLREAADLGRRLAEAIGSRMRFPDQEADREQCFEMMRWLVEQERDNWPYEYEYWQKHWPGK
ncbi:MAG: flavodoxin family protein [Proteobacteria bacterium]|nr:flavodoxin family protein [Pseudomonadota bacterium]